MQLTGTRRRNQHTHAQAIEALSHLGIEPGKWPAFAIDDGSKNLERGRHFQGNLKLLINGNQGSDWKLSRKVVTANSEEQYRADI